MHDLSLVASLLCVGAAVLAGFVDAVAGGGGLIQLPVMLAVFPTAPLALVSGTNKSVSIVGTTAASATFARRMPLRARVVAPMAVCAFIGSAAGATLVTRVSRATFEPVLLTVLIGVTMFTLARPDFGRVEHSRARGTVAACALGGVIGFYDGIMGPGTGMFLVLGGITVLGGSFLTSSAVAKFVNVATNLAALVVFVPSGNVLWHVTALMAPANLVGGVIGARTALTRGSVFVRVVFLCMILLLVARLSLSLR